MCCGQVYLVCGIVPEELSFGSRFRFLAINGWKNIRLDRIRDYRRRWGRTTRYHPICCRYTHKSHEGRFVPATISAGLFQTLERRSGMTYVRGRPVSVVYARGEVEPLLLGAISQRARPCTCSGLHGPEVNLRPTTERMPYQGPVDEVCRRINGASWEEFKG